MRRTSSAGPKGSKAPRDTSTSSAHHTERSTISHTNSGGQVAHVPCASFLRPTGGCHPKFASVGHSWMNRGHAMSRTVMASRSAYQAVCETPTLPRTRLYGQRPAAATGSSKLATSGSTECRRTRGHPRQCQDESADCVDVCNNRQARCRISLRINGLVSPDLPGHTHQNECEKSLSATRVLSRKIQSSVLGGMRSTRRTFHNDTHDASAERHYCRERWTRMEQVSLASRRLELKRTVRHDQCGLVIHPHVTTVHSIENQLTEAGGERIFMMRSGLFEPHLGHVASSVQQTVL